MRRALSRPQPAPLPGGLQLAVEERKPKEAGNPEVLLSRGLGDSFEWNRADSSPVLRARSLLSVRRCPRRRVATRPGERGKKTTCEKLYLPELARIGVNKKFVRFNKLKFNTIRITVTEQKYGQTS